ncbi:MAG: PAS domain S-box protein [Chitinophagaceae bacterium]
MRNSNHFVSDEEKFRALLDTAPDAMVISNRKGEIVLINQQTETLFGYKRTQLIGKPVEILIPGTFQTRHKGHRDHYFADPKVRTMGAGLELFAMRSDGTQFPVEISLSPLETTEGLLVSAAIRDITERKKAEVKFRGLLESAPDAMVIANEKGEIVLINYQTEVLFGYKKEELTGQLVELLVPAGARHKHTAHRSGYSKEPKVRSMGAGLELFAVRKDGSQFPVEISLSPLETTDGLLVSAAIRDITERKKSEEAITQLNKELESFTYSVSHDLRSPLRIIDGYADILITDYKDKLDNEGNRVLGIIKTNARRMGQLIDDLLNLSQVGRKELTRHLTDMKRLVSSVIGEQLSYPGCRATIKQGNLEPVLCDSSLIRQVWINLISNAIKYSGKQEQPFIETGSERKGEDIVYFVKDNGVGFDMKYAGNLFGVFQRLHKITEFEGTGIGLALVSRILAKHNGKIWAESEPGKGAVFYFSLPY